MPSILKAQTLAAIACTALTLGCQSSRSTVRSTAPSTPLSTADRASNKQPNRSKRSDINRSTREVSITISAASSLQNALSDIEPLFEQRYPDINIFYNWGGSGTLQRQIEQGAPADIFFSASPAQMSALAAQGRLKIPPNSQSNNRTNSQSDQVVLTNRLVLIAPENSQLKGFADLAKFENSQHIAVGEFRSVPAGQYAQNTLTHFQLLPQLSSQLVFFSNVRGVLAAVESGHADAGLVYLTDAELSSRVRVVAIAPENSHAPIQYPIAILQRSEHPQAAQQYIDFLSDPAVSETFRRYGFNPR